MTQIPERAALLLAVTLLASSCSSDETPSAPFVMPNAGLAPTLDEAVNEPNPATERRKVLFIAVDGLRADKLDNTDGDRLTIPNFERLQRDGIFVLESHQERLPDGRYRTCPGFIQMTTGKRIAAHGVKDNKDCDRGEFNDYPIFFRRLKEMRPGIRIAVAETTSQVVEIVFESCGGEENLKSRCGVEGRSFEKSHEGDVAGALQVLLWMMSGRYDVVWYHPHEVDAEGHATGWDGTTDMQILGNVKIDEVIERLDAEIIGPLLQAVAFREAQTLERWMIIVTADHGGHDTWRGGDHTTKDADKKVPIIVSGSLIPDDGNQGTNAFHTWDLPATIYDYLGLTPNPTWRPTDGTSILNRSN